MNITVARPQTSPKPQDDDYREQQWPSPCTVEHHHIIIITKLTKRMTLFCMLSSTLLLPVLQSTVLLKNAGISELIIH
jgi:hypothetical protein